MIGVEKDTFSLLEPIVALMPLVVDVDSVTTNSATLFTIYTDNTLWLTVGYVVTIGGNSYTVIDLVTNEWVKVRGTIAPSAASFSIRAPYFDHGTFLMKNAELKENVGNPWSYLPLMFLHEPTDNQNFPDDDDEAVGRIATCELYFLIDNKYSEWLTQDHYQYAVRPMRNLMNEFIKILKDNGNVGILGPFTDFDCPNWGISVDNKGNTRRLIDDELSGCGCRIDIPLLKSLTC